MAPAAGPFSVPRAEPLTGSRTASLRALSKGFALGTYLPKTISFVCAKRNGKKSRPRLSGARFRLAATYFLRTKKVGKDALRGANPAGEGRALMICPLRTPVFTGAQDRVMHRPISGVGVSRRSKPLISAAALLAVVVTCRALGTRLLSAGARLGTLPRAVEGASLVGTSGSGAGVQCILVTTAPVVEWYAADHGITLFFGGPTPFLLAR